MNEKDEAAKTLHEQVRSVENEADLYGEAIMLMREHLASVGIEATFADDAAAMAAAEIARLRALVARLVGVSA